jgi:hypothetical protein
LVGNQHQATVENEAIDATSELMRVAQFVKPISNASIASLATALESRGYSVSIVGSFPTIQRGDGQTLAGFRANEKARINELLKTNDAVLKVSYNYQFIKVGKTQSYVPYVLAGFGLFRRLDSDTLLHHAARATSRSEVDAMEGSASGPLFERADFLDQNGKRADAIRSALQSEFDTVNRIFLSEFSASDE